MTFKYKLSRRLALLKDRRVLSLAVVLAAAVANCERPVATGVGDGLAQLVVFPPTVNVVENQPWRSPGEERRQELDQQRLQDAVERRDDEPQQQHEDDDRDRGRPDLSKVRP